MKFFLLVSPNPEPHREENPRIYGPSLTKLTQHKTTRTVLVISVNDNSIFPVAQATSPKLELPCYCLSLFLPIFNLLVYLIVSVFKISSECSHFLPHPQLPPWMKVASCCLDCYNSLLISLPASTLGLLHFMHNTAPGESLLWHISSCHLSAQNLPMLSHFTLFPVIYKIHII